jgi:BlaI family transcriptional regulator, penicillinase repressor
MVKAQPATQFGRRERQIMDVVYRLGKASVSDVRGELPDPPTYSAVRGMMRLLEEKGYLTHTTEGLRYVYSPTLGPQQARRSALRHLVHTFFAGSSSDAAATLLELSDSKLNDADVARLSEIIRKAKTEGR